MTKNSPKLYLVTGCAGFIGHHVCIKLLQLGNRVIGIDNLAADQSSSFKKIRLNELNAYSKNLFTFYKEDISDRKSIESIFNTYQFDSIIHLAAKTGVRESATAYEKYFITNTIGTCNIIDCNKDQKAPLLFASSSSVYGNNKEVPFSEKQEVSSPISLYAVSKLSTELIAHNYAVNYDIPLVGLRFFTVYGPMGRPDMAAFLFIDAIANDRPLTLFNKGLMDRDFTYIDDIVNGIIELSAFYQVDQNKSKLLANKKPEIFNIGYGDTRKVIDLISQIEKGLGKSAKIDHQAKIKEDMIKTYSNTNKLHKTIGFKPQTNLEKGVQKTIEWYLAYKSSN